MIFSSRLLTLESCELWAASCRRRREFRLNEDLLHAILLLVKLVIGLVNLRDIDAMRDHLERVNLATVDHLAELIPVLVDGGLAVADEADATLHQGADVEVVGVADVDAGDAAAAVVLDRGDHLVDDLGRVGLDAEEQLKVVRPAFGVLAGDALERDVRPGVDAALGHHLLEHRGYGFAFGERGEVDGFDLGDLGLDVF